MATSKSVIRRQKLRWRIRTKVSGTNAKPRLSVFRSNKAIYAQLIDDATGTTIVAANSNQKSIAAEKGTKVEIAAMVGKELATKAIAAGINTAVFDRGGYLYHGRVKALADGAREGGLKI